MNIGFDGTRRNTILDWQAIDGNILHFPTARDGTRDANEAVGVAEQRKKWSEIVNEGKWKILAHGSSQRFY